MSKYTLKTNIPQYTPKDAPPTIKEIYDLKKYDELIKSINNSNVSDEEKNFLRDSATRHIVFNYSKIADYYAFATKEMQNLMEESALVIIDIDNAISNGYVRLNKEIQNIIDCRIEDKSNG